MKLKTITTLLLTVVACTAWAQGPNGTGTYYKTADGKSGQTLKTALWNIIKSPNVVSYSGLKEAYKKTDTRSNGYLRDWYSNITKYVPGSAFVSSYNKEGDGYNREHLVPQSWFSKASPMRSDIVHVVPTDGYINGRRGDYYLADVGNVTYQSANGYSKLGSCATPGYSGTVFEPNDEIKGDIARIYFYMVTCYEDKSTGWGNVFTSYKYPGLQQWYVDMLMQWSEQDPVDAVEIQRNNAVYDVQQNRNPFVDYPGLEQYVWGSLSATAFSYDNYSEPSGIFDINSDEPATANDDNAVYDLRGRRISDTDDMRPGVYIRGGKKILVR